MLGSILGTWSTRQSRSGNEKKQLTSLRSSLFCIRDKKVVGNNIAIFLQL